MRLSVPAFIRSLVHSLIRSFIDSFIRSFIHEFIHPLIIRRPLVLGQGRQACGDNLPPPCFPPPEGPKPSSLYSPAAAAADLAQSFLSFETLSPFKAVSGPILELFGTDFESILAAKIGPKMTQVAVGPKMTEVLPAEHKAE